MNRKIKISGLLAAALFAAAGCEDDFYVFEDVVDTSILQKNIEEGNFYITAGKSDSSQSTMAVSLPYLHRLFSLSQSVTYLDWALSVEALIYVIFFPNLKFRYIPAFELSSSFGKSLRYCET